MVRSFLIAAALVAAAPAAAVTVIVDQTLALAETPFAQTSQIIVLPTGFTNALLNITSLTADDAAVVTINGTAVFSAGIFGPGNGNFFFTVDGSSVPFTFASDNGVVNASFAAPFVVGNNFVEVFYNNNNAGINAGNGPLTGGPGNLDFVGTVTFDVPTGGVPEPQSWMLLIAGFGLVGVSMRRRTVVAA